MGNKGCYVIKVFIKLVLKNVIKRAFGLLNNNFQYSFKKKNILTVKL